MGLITLIDRGNITNIPSCRFLMDQRFPFAKLMHDSRQVLYRVPEIVTLERLPGEGESDSRWRIREVRHVGPDTLTPGF